MENKSKKQIVKYLYFVFVGIIIGYIIGHCNNRNTIADNRDVQHIIYEADTAASINGWYGSEYDFVEVDSGL